MGADSKFSIIDVLKCTQLIMFVKNLFLLNLFVAVMITDLNNDGSQEIVSYSVSYKKVDQNIRDFSLFTREVSLNNWELQSKIRVIRLQEELSEFYESSFHH